MIRDSGLDPNQPQPPLFRIFIAEEHINNITIHVGFATVFNTYSSWKGTILYLESLYVKESHRSKCVGKQLMLNVVRHATEMGCRCIEFHVNKSNPSIQFYKNLGTIDFTESEGYALYLWRAN